LEKSLADSITDFDSDQVLKISQPQKGYRFSMDALMLASHVKVKGNEKLIDIGCGSGIISILLAHKYPGLNIIGIEIQEELYKLAQKNIKANGLEGRIRIIHDDVKNIKISKTEEPADIIVSNPPFGKKGAGRISPNPQKAIAKHEIALDQDSLLNCSNRLLKDKGKLFMIFPFNRRKELRQGLIQYNFQPEYSHNVCSKADEEPLRIIICAVKKGDF
jgi:tRNA1Val (adenine37-N6)-methyltransferase